MSERSPAGMVDYVYTHAKPPLAETPDQLRARIPGWGADLDPADRPSVPQERFDPALEGVAPALPPRQPELRPRERSVEHAMLTPVFGTSCPTRGLSGAIRRFSYARFSEGRAAHWLLLIAADRVDVKEGMVRALLRGRPDNPVRETGITAELTRGGWSSRRGRVDARHHVMDPAVMAGPWVAGAVAAAAGLRWLRRRH